MTTFGDGALWVNVCEGAILTLLLITGTWIYGRQIVQRRASGGALLLKARGWWRTLHRCFAVISAVFLCIVILSGTWLAIDSLALAINLPKHMISLPSGQKVPPFFDPRLLKPLQDQDIAPMARSTLTAYRSAFPQGTARAVRLRNYAGYAQGVVITGEAEPQQIVFDTHTGRKMLLTEPGYPDVGLPLGWQAHQWAKHIHRGDVFGLTGRMMSLLSGFCVVYLSISGIVMYIDLWLKRRRAGNAALVW